MFTGIIEESGLIERIQAADRSTELVVRSKKIARGLRAGMSVAVNGACLTVTRARRGSIRFDLLAETIDRTNLSLVRVGEMVNLERPVPAQGRFDGHLVLGHVDARGKVRRFERESRDYVLEIEAPSSLMEYVIEKGSIAVDGISLTVAKVGRGWFRTWIIPHTRALTNLRQCRKGRVVNLEADVIGKYVKKFVRRTVR
jgi:riboflavin synthase